MIDRTTQDDDLTIETVLEALSKLRYRVTDFEESIGTYIDTVENYWVNVRTWLGSFESRLAGLEARLQAAQPEPGWQSEELDYMLKELEKLDEDMREMQAEFLESLQESPRRIM